MRAEVRQSIQVSLAGRRVLIARNGGDRDQAGGVFEINIHEILRHCSTPRRFLAEIMTFHAAACEPRQDFCFGSEASTERACVSPKVPSAGALTAQRRS